MYARMRIYLQIMHVVVHTCMYVRTCIHVIFVLFFSQDQSTTLHVTNNVEILKLLIDAGGIVNAVDEVSSCVMSDRE